MVFKKIKWALTSHKKRQKKMGDLKSILNLYTPTADLLKMAAEKNITIKFDPKLIGTKTYGRHNAFTGEIILHPYLGDAQTLAHELRHMWQYDTLNTSRKVWAGAVKGLKNSLLFTRILEMDARAFDETFAQACVYIDEALQELSESLSKLNLKNADDLAKLHYKKEPMPDTNILMRANFENMARRKYNYYDMNRARYYVDQHIDKTERVDPLPLSKLRDLFNVRVGHENVNYLSDVSDKVLISMLESSMTDDATTAISLMDEFEQRKRDATTPKDHYVAMGYLDAVDRHLYKKGF